MAMQFNASCYFHIPEVYWNISDYRSTLGHKVNHNFKAYKVKATFKHAYNPTFGNIGSIYSTSDIQKGEEILVNYAYVPGRWVPEWYSSLYFKEFGKPWPKVIYKWQAFKYSQYEQYTEYSVQKYTQKNSS
jgi:hypothetical protein